MNELKPAARIVACVPKSLFMVCALLLPAIAILLCASVLDQAPAAAPEASMPTDGLQRPSGGPPLADPSSTARGDAPELSVLAQLGRKMFFDPSLSGSGKLACASCHDPSNAYAPANDLAVQLGGPDGKKAGLRAVPSLTYLSRTPLFRIGPDPDIPDNDEKPPPIVAPADDLKVAAGAKADMADDANVPRGGLDWDGRAASLQAQALGPLLDPNEMNNRSAEEVLDHLEHAPYAEEMKTLFGPMIFTQPVLALDEARFALVRFQLEERSFHPYDSKYDAYLAGNAQLSEAEARGLKLFDDRNKGNCFSCHLDKPSKDGKLPPVFTDYEFEALGAPRNMNIPANQDPNYYDLGLCGPLRKDYANAGPYCGLFKTPSLRNVATRKVFFHNGVFRSLEEMMHFYVERDTNPDKWYPKLANGEIDLYNDLPPRYKPNIDVIDAPFDRKFGDQPALNDAEIADVIAFLKTLTDGYRPQEVQPYNSTDAAK
jgi:cytochrome c peroxidase